MTHINYELYLDESGNFENDRRNQISSLVGGILIRPNQIAPSWLDANIPEGSHACEDYASDNLQKLESLKGLGCTYVLFENAEQLRIVTGDITYLNVICEGLVQLAKRLSCEHPQDSVRLDVCIARRINVERLNKEGVSVDIPEEEYQRRINEKLIVATGRERIANLTWNVRFGSARKDKLLMIADIVCNTRYKYAKGSFSAGDRAHVESIYADALVFSVFEDATLGYMQRLLMEQRCSELINQLCALEKPERAASITEKLLAMIRRMNYDVRNNLFSNVSLQIRYFNDALRYEDGIEFALRYRTLILEKLEDTDYWRFDTDFFLLTMYDHLGDLGKCSEYIERCNANIGALDRSWEHLNYYFNYRVRELTCRINRFEFDRVVKGADELIKLLDATKDLFQMIEASDRQIVGMKSNTLAKVYGVKLEALINLLPQDPALYDEALETSDLELKEFTNEKDRRRALQARCMLFAAAGRTKKAQETLKQALDGAPWEIAVADFFKDVHNIDYFALVRYAEVMVLLKEAADPGAKDLYDALMANSNFVGKLNDRAQDSNEGYPWNLLLWYISRYQRLDDSLTSAKDKLERAIAISKRNPSAATVYSFAVSFAADRLLFAKRTVKADEKKALKEYVGVCRQLTDSPYAIQPILDAFNLTKGGKPAEDEETLERVAKAYLK